MLLVDLSGTDDVSRGAIAYRGLINHAASYVLLAGHTCYLVKRC